MERSATASSLEASLLSASCSWPAGSWAMMCLAEQDLRETAKTFVRLQTKILSGNRCP